MSNKLQEILDTVPSFAHLAWGDHELDTDQPEDPDTGMPHVKRVSMVITHGKPGYGFGEFTFVADEKGQTFIDTECGDPEIVKEFLCLLVDNAILSTDTDPERHKKYNEIMKRTCGPRCKVCG